MKKEAVSNIGLVIHRQEFYYKRRVSDWERLLLPAITTIIEHYRTLELGEFTQEVYKELMTNGTKNIEPLYRSKIEQQTKSLVPQLRELALKDWQKPLVALKESISKFREKITTIYSHNLMDNAGIDIYHVLIENGMATIDKEAVRRDYETTITNDRQSEVYNKLLTFQEHYHSLVAFLKEQGLDFTRFRVIGQDGLLYEVDDEQLVINGPVLVTAF